MKTISLLPREIGKQINQKPWTNKQKYIARQIVRRVNRCKIENKVDIRIFLKDLSIEIYWGLFSIFVYFDDRSCDFEIIGELDNPQIWEQCDLIRDIVCIKNGPHQKLSL